MHRWCPRPLPLSPASRAAKFLDFLPGVCSQSLAAPQALCLTPAPQVESRNPTPKICCPRILPEKQEPVGLLRRFHLNDSSWLFRLFEIGVICVICGYSLSSKFD